ncbi:MAG: hypothetical protein ACLRWQ_03570 [Flavonifractor plautii]
MEERSASRGRYEMALRLQNHPRLRHLSATSTRHWVPPVMEVNWYQSASNYLLEFL